MSIAVDCDKTVLLNLAYEVMLHKLLQLDGAQGKLKKLIISRLCVFQEKDNLAHALQSECKVAQLRKNCRLCDNAVCGVRIEVCPVRSVIIDVLC